MSKERPRRDVDLGPLHAVLGEEGGESDPEPESGPSQVPQAEQSEQSYWRAHYYTRPKSNVGVSITAIKYPLKWPKEKVLQAIQEVRARDRFAVEGTPVFVRQESAGIKLFF